MFVKKALFVAIVIVVVYANTDLDQHEQDNKTYLARSERHPRAAPVILIPVIIGCVSLLFQVAAVGMQAYDMAEKSKEGGISVNDIKAVLDRVDTNLNTLVYTLEDKTVSDELNDWINKVDAVRLSIDKFLDYENELTKKRVSQECQDKKVYDFVIWIKNQVTRYGATIYDLISRNKIPATYTKWKMFIMQNLRSAMLSYNICLTVNNDGSELELNETQKLESKYFNAILDDINRVINERDIGNPWTFMNKTIDNIQSAENADKFAEELSKELSAKVSYRCWTVIAWHKGQDYSFFIRPSANNAWIINEDTYPKSQYYAFITATDIESCDDLTKNGKENSLTNWKKQEFLEKCFQDNVDWEFHSPILVFGSESLLDKYHHVTELFEKNCKNLNAFFQWEEKVLDYWRVSNATVPGKTCPKLKELGYCIGYNNRDVFKKDRRYPLWFYSV